MEHEIDALQEENADLLRELREMNERKSPFSSAMKNEESSDDKLKLETAEARIAELEEKLKESRICQQEFELQNVELQNLKNKIERLESERALWEEGKHLVARASRASDFEKELNSAKETIAGLRESVKGKLILEEQISTLTQRYLTNEIIIFF